MAAKILVTIIRHGETDHNAAKIIQGHLDTPLNEEGEAQARVTGRHLRSIGVAFDQAWASDLSRARRTAELILLEQEDACELQLDERIRERHLGDLQGKRWGDEGVDITTIEPAPVLLARLFSFWDSLLPPSASHPPPTSDQHILLVSHGGSIRALVAGLVQDRRNDYQVTLVEDEVAEGIKKRVANCSVTTFEVQKIGEGGVAPRWLGSLRRFADADHFQESSRMPSPSGNVDEVDA